ncbi:hypothetical protein [Thioalkalivibrio thiocyanodenitrificans]|uniref:hypothetical protein n=1 Tax=Thioalkalivibrio thiocyanodenitrificans TaxID=243063 RepID=UPI0012EAFED2|nr:hypothetical protein [Thioalkalivibrio thiocyanodenitrificans]
MKPSRSVTIIRRLLALVAILFGVVTIIAGARILGGADPGYTVFGPLLIYNTGMGVAYVAAGILAWRNPLSGRRAAAAISLLNLLVLGAIAYLYTAGSAVAVESLGAMTFRTVVWLLLFLGLAWVSRRSNVHGIGRDA